MRKLKLALVTILALTTFCFADTRFYLSQLITTSGGTYAFNNAVGAMTLSVEETINGAPSTVSITIQGCGEGSGAGVCETLDTYTTVASAIRSPSISKLYESFVVTASWTGGTSPSIQVIPFASTSRNTTGSNPVLFPLLAPNGSAAAPPYSFAANSQIGFFNDAGNGNRVTVSGGNYASQAFGGNNFQLGGGVALTFSSGAVTSTNPDAGISRDAADVIDFGNGNQSDTSANLQFNKISKYNSTTTSGQGVSWIPCTSSQKSETGADANVLTCTPAAAAGTYRVAVVLSVSAASSATLGWTATWTDSNGNAQSPTNLALSQSGTAAPALTFTTSVAGNYYGSWDVDVNSAGANIVIKTTFSGTSIAYKATAVVERLI